MWLRDCWELGFEKTSRMLYHHHHDCFLALTHHPVDIRRCALQS